MVLFGTEKKKPPPKMPDVRTMLAKIELFTNLESIALSEIRYKSQETLFL